MSQPLYDTIIIGAGAAGLSAGVYAGRGKLRTLILHDRKKTGGQAATTMELENYPGFLETTGPALMKTFKDHADKFGVTFQQGEVVGLRLDDDQFTKILTTKDGQEYHAKSVIVATGAEPRILGIKGEEEFKGRGVSYCATCDADFFEDLDIVVLGSGNTAVEEAIFLGKFVNKITMIVLHDEGIMDAEKPAREKAFAHPKIDFVWNSVLEEIKGDELVTGVVLKNLKTGDLTELPCDGVFMFVGTVPKTEFLKDIVDLTPSGYIKVSPMMESSFPGVYGAGDVVDKYLRQVVTAASDGSIAAVAADKYIEEEENWQHNVLQFEGDVLVAFWSATNQASMDTISFLEQHLTGQKDRKLVKIDTYKNQLISRRYNVTTIPTVLTIRQGKVEERLESPTQEALEKLIA